MAKKEVNYKTKMTESFIKEVEYYFEKNRDIFNDYVELTKTPINKDEKIENSIEILIRGINFSTIFIKLSGADIRNMMMDSVESGLTTTILDALINFDTEDDFYMNVYSDDDSQWDDFDEEELMDMVLEDEEVFSALIVKLGGKHD